jgi:hypothetical protein
VGEVGGGRVGRDGGHRRPYITAAAVVRHGGWNGNRGSRAHRQATANRLLAVGLLPSATAVGPIRCGLRRWSYNFDKFQDGHINLQIRIIFFKKLKSRH